MRETAIEAHLTKRVIALGGLSVKLLPATAGIPDRMIILPRGRIFLIELKSPTGRLRPVQTAWHNKLKKRGVPVAVLSSKTAVDAWIAEHT